MNACNLRRVITPRMFAKRWGMLSVVVLAFLLRLTYASATAALWNPRTWEQEQIATNLIERHAFLFETPMGTYRSYTEPLYPFLAAGVYLVTSHSQSALVIVQILISTMTVLLTGRIGERIKGRGAGSIAALLTAIHPGLIHYASVLHPFVLDSFFFVAAAVLLIRYRQSATSRDGVAGAAVIGLGALTRPTILLFLIPLCWTAWRSTDGLAARSRRTAGLAALALAVVLPWTIRNAAIHHTFMLTRSGTGFVFWLGNNPRSSGSAILDGGQPVVFTAPPELLLRARSANEVQRDRIFEDAAWAYIRQDPGAALRRIGRRLIDFWWFSQRWGLKFSRPARLVYRWWWIAILSLTVAGAFETFRLEPMRRRSVWLLIGIAVLISVGQSVYYVEGRHRLAIEPLLMPVAAIGALFITRAVFKPTNVVID
jgi:4-amino-4-deoxy-L-arabinose transferase-like glycosyltransferase